MTKVIFLIEDMPNKDEQYSPNTNPILNHTLRSPKFKLLLQIVKKYISNCEFYTICDKYYTKLTKVVMRNFKGLFYDLLVSEGDKVIVTMGLSAFKFLEDQKVVMKDIAGIPQYSEVFKCWVYPTYSFQALLSYNMALKGQAYFERQIIQLKAMIEDPDYKPYSIDYYKSKITIHTTDLEVAIETIRYWKQNQGWAFDIETAGYRADGQKIPKEAQLDKTHSLAEITCIAIGTGDRVDVYNLRTLPSLIPYLKKLFETAILPISWNGLSFDAEFIKTLWHINFPPHIDGRVCYYITDANMSSLKYPGINTLKSASANFLSSKYAGYQKIDGLDKAMKEGDADYILEHEDAFLLYCGIDVLVTHILTTKLYEALPAKMQGTVLNYYTQIAQLATNLKAYGIKVDLELLKVYIDKITAFCSQFTFPINVGSSKQLGEYLYTTLGIEAHYTETGNYTVDSETLAEIDHPFVKKVLVYKKFHKELEQLHTLEERLVNGRIIQDLNFLGTASGRMSSGFHTAPKKFELESPLASLDRPIWENHKITDKKTLIEYSPNYKKLIVADEGYTLLYADYNQLEVVILACMIDLFGTDKTLQTAIREGKDLHSYTASLLYSTLKHESIPYELIYKKGKKEKIEPYHTWRQDAKSVIFKLIFGGTYHSLAEEKGISKDEAKAIWDTYLRIIPGIKEYMQYQANLAIREKKIATFFGHTRALPILSYDPTNTKAKNISLNHPIQGTATHIVNQAVLMVEQEVTKVLGHILFSIHDSIAIQVPHNRVLDGAKMLKWCMIDYISKKYSDLITVPLSTEIEAGPNWADVKEIL